MVDFYASVVSGLVGGAIASAVIYLISLVKSHLITRKYPVSGVYSATFDDDTDVGSVSNCRVRLKQRGRKIWGVDTAEDGRTWMLEGQIVGGGHITGIYSAEAHHDLGVGVFYLRIMDDGMYGIWSGYANRLGKTTSGQYNLKKLDEKSRAKSTEI